MLWQFTVHSVFTVTTVFGAVCTNAAYGYSVFDSDWTFVSSASYPSDNMSIGNGEFSSSLLFIPVENRQCGVELACDSFGNLS